MKKRAVKKSPIRQRRRFPKEECLLVPIRPADHARIAKMAEASDLTIERWLTLAVLNACTVDEAHWQELEAREQIRFEIDREQFARLSLSFRSLPPRAIDRLVDVLVRAQEKGRRDGSASALRLVALRGAK